MSNGLDIAVLRRHMDQTAYALADYVVTVENPDPAYLLYLKDEFRDAQAAYCRAARNS